MQTSRVSYTFLGVCTQIRNNNSSEPLVVSCSNQQNKQHRMNRKMPPEAQSKIQPTLVY